MWFEEGFERWQVRMERMIDGIEFQKGGGGV